MRREIVAALFAPNLPHMLFSKRSHMPAKKIGSLSPSANRHFVFGFPFFHAGGSVHSYQPVAGTRQRRVANALRNVFDLAIPSLRALNVVSFR